VRRAVAVRTGVRGLAVAGRVAVLGRGAGTRAAVRTGVRRLAVAGRVAVRGRGDGTEVAAAASRCPSTRGDGRTLAGRMSEGRRRGFWNALIRNSVRASGSARTHSRRAGQWAPSRRSRTNSCSRSRRRLLPIKRKTRRRTATWRTTGWNSGARRLGDALALEETRNRRESDHPWSEVKLRTGTIFMREVPILLNSGATQPDSIAPLE
jgi:hypothetical protein